jgi:hypothetical protein
MHKFNPADAIAVITGSREEVFPLERDFALIGFVAWMLKPKDPQFAETAQVVGAARYFVDTEMNASLARKNPHFSQRNLARTLLRFPLGDTFRMEYDIAFNDLESIYELINFFMLCPQERKPSLLKAIYFIENDGFISNDVVAGERRHFKRAASTLKKNWVSHLVSGPFIWAAISLDFEYLLKLAPDQISTKSKVSKFLARPTAVSDFFGLAKFCQERLLSYLDWKTMGRFKLIKFPPNFNPQDFDLPSLDAAQIAILLSYKKDKALG